MREQVDLAPLLCGLVPLWLFDLWCGARFRERSLKDHISPSNWGVALKDLAIWTLGFGLWVALVGEWSERAQWLRWFGPDFYLQLWLVFRAQAWLTLLALLLWLGAYSLAVLRFRRLRLETSIVLPVLLSAALFAHLTFGGGVGALSIEEVVAQPGVSLELDPRTLNIEGDAKTSLQSGPLISCSETDKVALVQRSVPYRWHPRDVVAVDGALIVSYGCSFCMEEGVTPTVLRLPREPSQGEVHCFRSGNLHHIDVVQDRERVWAAPWTNRQLYALRLSDLSVEFPMASPKRGQMRFFQPIQIVEDINGEALYAGTELESTLVRFDLKARRYQDQLRLADLGLVRFGGPLHFIEQHPTTRRLYFTSGPGHNLFEVDPDSMEVVRSMTLDDVVGTALLLDPAGERIFYQSGVRDALHEVDLKSWKVTRTFKGEIHARRLTLDRQRDALYVLGHLSGQLSAIDLKTGQRRWSVAVGGRPHGLSQDGDALWVNSFAGLFRLHLPTLWGEP